MYAYLCLYCLGDGATFSVCLYLPEQNHPAFICFYSNKSFFFKAFNKVLIMNLLMHFSQENDSTLMRMGIYLLYDGASLDNNICKHK